jgi:hypothetical protein
MGDESTPPVGAEVHRATTSGDPRPIDGFEPSDWSYRQHRRGKADRQYVGQVRRIGGAEGERMRRKLAGTIAELLMWAAEQEREQGGGAT